MEKHVAAILLEHAGESGGREILLALGRADALRDFDRECGIRAALHLLQERVDRVQIRDRLVDRGFSQRSAYRILDQALARFCQMGRMFGKGALQNQGSNTNA